MARLNRICIRIAERREEIIALSHVMARTSRAMTCLENSALSRAYPDAYAVKPGHDDVAI